MNELIDLYPNEVEDLISKDIIMIDVRRPDEWSMTGVIKNSYKLTFFDMFGNHDIQSWMYEFDKLVTSKEQPFVLICAHANRTRTIGNFLIQNFGYEKVSHLYGGIALWQEEGRKLLFD